MKSIILKKFSKSMIKILNQPIRLIPRKKYSKIDYIRKINVKESNIIAVANQKGGCGKTTTAINLAGSLVAKGKNVLIIDLDPQAHASLGLGIEINSIPKSIYNVLIDRNVKIEDIILPTLIPGLNIAPTTPVLACALTELAAFDTKESMLRASIVESNVTNLYDYIVIDCSPSLSLLTINALVAAKNVLIPIQTHYYSLEGLKEFLSTINLIKEKLNSELKILGILPTIFDPRLNINRLILEQLKGYFKDMMLSSVIHSNVKICEAPIYRKPVNFFEPRSKGAKDYMNLAEEILGILEGKSVKELELTTEHRDSVYI